MDSPGYDSLNFVATMIGEEWTEPGLLVVLVVMLERLLCSDDEEGRRPGRELGVYSEGENGE
jgi:hypothetical protein